eukprot:COSAG01_NODE_514_length_16043_cov_248.614212_17_plen_118_part_00
MGLADHAARPPEAAAVRAVHADLQAAAAALVDHAARPPEAAAALAVHAVPLLAAAAAVAALFHQVGLVEALALAQAVAPASRPTPSSGHSTPQILLCRPIFSPQDDPTNTANGHVAA